MPTNTNLIATLGSLQRATLSARQRLNDQAIGTEVDKGHVRVVRVEFSAGKRNAVVSPVSDWLPADDAVRLLEGMQ